jgi:dihydroxy-acid dehydratase
MHRSHGHCMTMGTASTMASMVEALGHRACPGNAAYPAVDGRRNVIARSAGRRIVEMVTPTRRARRADARGVRERDQDARRDRGSTNAVIHLPRDRRPPRLEADERRLRQARERAAVPREPAALGQVLMEDFCYAGGLRW